MSRSTSWNKLNRNCKNRFVSVLATYHSWLARAHYLWQQLAVAKDDALEHANRESAAAARGDINSKELHDRIDELEKELEVSRIGWLMAQLAIMRTDLLRCTLFFRRRENVIK